MFVRKVKNLKKYLKSNVRSILLVTIVVALGLTIFSQVFFQENERVSPEIMKRYVQEFFSYYQYLDSGQNVPFSDLNITNVSNFTFGFQSYDTTVVISSSHGAALIFNRSEDESEIFVKQISDPVEYYVWPQMAENLDDLPTVGIKRGGEYILDGIVTVHDAIMYVEPEATIRCVFKDRPLVVTNTGAVIFFGDYILEHTILLKGSNNKNDWSITQANLDALSEYLWDCKSVGMNKTAVQNIEKKYKPSILLEKIATRMKNGDYKANQALFNSDYEELEKVSNESMDDMLTKILNDFYALQQESKPDLFEQILNYFFIKLDAIIIGAIMSIIGIILGNKFISKDKKR